MRETTKFLAIDLGASSGRVMRARWDGATIELSEIHRFANRPVRTRDGFQWDILALWRDIKAGLAKAADSEGKTLAGIGVDTWGLDFALLDRQGHLLANPYHYRDDRTLGMLELAFERVPRSELFRATGIQFMRLNSLYQILSMVHADDPRLEAADTLLFIPDLLHHWLGGQAVAEYTIASTSQMLRAGEQAWATDLLARLNVPTRILPDLIPPGTVVGELRSDLVKQLGFAAPVPIVAPAGHDTGSAVAAIPDLGENDAYISSGTWSLVGVETPQVLVNDAALELNVTNEAGVAGTNRLLKNVTGLWLVQECRRQWTREGDVFHWEDLTGQAEQAQPLRSIIDPDAPAFVSPPDMVAAVRGFCRRTDQPVPHTVGEVVRCCLESLSLKYSWVVEALERVIGHPLDTVRVVGGGSRNTLLCQFTADACQRPVVAGPAEATALGNAMIQAVGRRYLSDVAEGRQAIAASVRRHRYVPGPSAPWDAASAKLEAIMDRATDRGVS